MIINGIIAEYNPLHNGHLYQLEESKKCTGATYTVVVMSGNFVQRGTPALIDKYTRAEWALKNGADLVLELPSLCACSSAEYFAAGAVALLHGLGVVTHLCFGSESGDIALLSKIADNLQSETKEYQSCLKSHLQRGENYPTARAKALVQQLETSETVMSSPNNILGIEYIRQLRRLNSPICPFTIKRQGAGYHETPDFSGIPHAFLSASGIRKELLEEGIPTSVRSSVPSDVSEALQRKKEENMLIFPDDISEQLHYKLLAESLSGYDAYLDISSSLSDRILNVLDLYNGFESFCSLLKTKELTYTRISRGLLHILLNITKEDMKICRNLGYAPYARILGFRRDSVDLLSLLKRHAAIPLIPKLADAKKILAPSSYALLQKEILISRLYQGIVAGKSGTIIKNEYAISPIIR